MPVSFVHYKICPKKTIKFFFHKLSCEKNENTEVRSNYILLCCKYFDLQNHPLESTPPQYKPQINLVVRKLITGDKCETFFFLLHF